MDGTFLIPFEEWETRVVKVLHDTHTIGGDNN